MMQVNVTLKGALRDYLPAKVKGKTTLDLPDGAVAKDIISQINIRQTVLFVNNGTRIEPTDPLQEGDEVQIISMLRGG